MRSIARRLPRWRQHRSVRVLAAPPSCAGAGPVALRPRLATSVPLNKTGTSPLSRRSVHPHSNLPFCLTRSWSAIASMGLVDARHLELVLARAVNRRMCICAKCRSSPTESVEEQDFISGAQPASHRETKHAFIPMGPLDPPKRRCVDLANPSASAAEVVSLRPLKRN